MEFHRLAYPLFLLAVFVAARAAARNLAARNAVLLLASYAFYAYADPRYLALLVGVTAVAYFGAPLLAPARGGARRTRLAFLIALELSGLVAVKYWDFAAQTVNAILAGSIPILHVAAVAGISFYTFQAIGYLVDVYRGEIEPERDAIVFALFVGFFPQLLAGPIGRAPHLLPQWKRLPPRDDRLISVGLFLLFSGAAKKVLLGDFLGTRLVNPIFAYPTGVGWIGVLLGTYGFAFQLYGDFAGYSEMAIGSARCLGIGLAPNFDAPYRSRNISEFWQRWHISLSTWIRDYVFLPMSGRAPSKGRTLAAAVGSMTLCGLWHGASFAWIGWGAMHGAGLAVHRTFLDALRRRFALKKKLAVSLWFRAASILVTFHFCCALLLLVRGGDPVLQGVASASEAWSKLGVMARELTALPRAGGDFYRNPITFAVLALAVLTHAMPGRWKLAMARGWSALPRPAQGGVAVLGVLGLFLVRPDRSPFIYTNF